MKKTFKDYSSVLFGSGFSRIASFITAVLIARFLGPEGFGEFSLFFIIMTLTWQFAQAFDVTFVRYAVTHKEPLQKNNFLKVSVFFKICYFFICLIISFPLAYFLANYCFHKPDIFHLILKGIIAGCFLIFLMTVSSIFQEKGKFLMFSILYSFYTIPILLIIILLKALNLEFNINLVVFVFLAISIIIGIVSFLIVLSRTGKLFPLYKKSLQISLSLAKWIFGSTFILFIFFRLDTLFLGRYLTLNSVGIYNAAVQIVIIIGLVTGSLSGVFLPKASLAVKSKKHLNAYIKESFFAVGLIVLFALGLFIFSNPIISILYGLEYAKAIPILRILIIGWIFYICYFPFSFLFYAKDDSKTKFFIEIIKLFLIIILLINLVPKYGVIGAAISFTASLFVEFIISIVILQRKFNILGKRMRYKL